MRQIRYCITYVLCGLVPLMIHTKCSNQVGPVENKRLQGNIVGKLNTADGSPAKGATVCLIPDDYNPYNNTGAMAIESTTTNNDGDYAFSVQLSGFYNVASRSTALKCFQDSVYGAGNMQFEVTTGILKAPGSISGTVHLRPEDDNRSAIILVLGTATYVQPEDTSGTFTINDLAEGVYDLQIVTTENGYGVLDTSLRVVAGEMTTIEKALELPWINVPAIGMVTAEQNTAMQIVTLSWSPVDTTNVECLYVFRNSGIARKPLAVLKKSATGFIDDSLSSFRNGDTLRYLVAACGTNGTTGPVGTAPAVSYKALFLQTGSISLDGIPHIRPLYGFTVDDAMQVYAHGEAGWVSKVDSTGRLIADYCDNYCVQSETGLYVPDVPRAVSVAYDNNGNVYMINEIDSTLIRLSDNLTERESCRFVPGITFGSYPRFTDNAGCLVIWGPSDTLWRVDSTLTMIDTIVFPEGKYGDFEGVHDDRYIFTEYMDRKIFFVDTNDLIAVDSVELGVIQSQYDSLIGTNDLVERPADFSPAQPFTFTYVNNVMTFRNGVFSFCCHDYVFFMNAEKRIIGRAAVGTWGNFETDGIDHFFAYDWVGRAVIIYKIEWNEIVG